MQTFLSVSTTVMASCLSSSCKWNIVWISLSRAIPSCYVSMYSYVSISFIFNSSYGVQFLSCRLYDLLQFSSNYVSFLFDYFYLFCQIEISTLVVVSYQIYGTLVGVFSIFLMAMDILGQSFLQFTAMNLVIASQLFTNSTACF